MRATKRVFCAPVRSACSDEARPTGNETDPVDSTRPRVGDEVPAISFRRVDFPAPFAPTRPTETPVGKTVFRLSATILRCPCIEKTLVRFSRTIIARASTPVAHGVGRQHQDAPAEAAEQRRQRHDLEPL